MSRPNPATSDHARAVEEDHQAVLERMRRQLSQAWAAGHASGEDGDPADANPYGSVTP